MAESLTQKKAKELAQILHEDLGIVKIDTLNRHIHINFKNGCPECDGYGLDYSLIAVVCRDKFGEYLKFVWSNDPGGKRNRPIRWGAKHSDINAVAKDIYDVLLARTQAGYASARKKAILDYVIEHMMTAGFTRIGESRFAIKDEKGTDWAYAVELNELLGVVKVGRGWSSDKYFPLAHPGVEKEIEQWIFNDLRKDALCRIIEEVEDAKTIESIIDPIAALATDKKFHGILEMATMRLKGGTDAS